MHEATGNDSMMPKTSPIIAALLLLGDARSGISAKLYYLLNKADVLMGVVSGRLMADDISACRHHL